MCLDDGIVHNSLFETRNGSVVGITQKGKKYTGTVIKSTDRKFPIGSTVEYQSEMGHVLCKGHGTEECDLHPLDALNFQDEDDVTVPQQIREALRRRRYNVRRSMSFAETAA